VEEVFNTPIQINSDFDGWNKITIVCSDGADISSFEAKLVNDCGNYQRKMEEGHYNT